MIEGWGCKGRVLYKSVGIWERYPVGHKGKYGEP